jgi:hypothetical protein
MLHAPTFLFLVLAATVAAEDAPAVRLEPQAPLAEVFRHFRVYMPERPRISQGEEDGQAFVRIASSDAINTLLRREVPLPTGATEVLVSWKVRLQAFEPGPIRYQVPRIRVHFNADEPDVGAWVQPFTVPDLGWQSGEAVVPVPAGVSRATVSIGLLNAKGSLDVAALQARFR